MAISGQGPALEVDEMFTMAPLLLWMWIARRETGFWTGVDRLAPRTFPEGAAHWAGLTTAQANVLQAMEQLGFRLY